MPKKTTSVAAEQEGPVTFIAANPIIKPTAGEGTSGEVSDAKERTGDDAAERTQGQNDVGE